MRREVAVSLPQLVENGKEKAYRSIGRRRVVVILLKLKHPEIRLMD